MDLEPNAKRVRGADDASATLPTIEPVPTGPLPNFMPLPKLYVRSELEPH
jgi:hypothetical protein